MSTPFFFTPLPGSRFGVEAKHNEISALEIIEQNPSAIRGEQRRILLPAPPIILSGSEIPGRQILNRDSLQAQLDRMGRHDRQQIATLMAIELDADRLGPGQLFLMQFLLGPVQRLSYYRRDPLSQQQTWKAVIEQVERDASLYELVSCCLYNSESLERRHYEHLLGGRLTKSAIEKWLRHLRTESHANPSYDDTAKSSPTRNDWMNNHGNKTHPTSPATASKIAGEFSFECPDNNCDGEQAYNNTSQAQEDGDLEKTEKVVSPSDQGALAANAEAHARPTLSFSDRIRRLHSAADQADKMHLLTDNPEAK